VLGRKVSSFQARNKNLDELFKTKLTFFSQKLHQKNRPYFTLGELQRECDIITFHTPLTRDGQWPTWHLCDQAFLNGLTHCHLIMNAARGPIADNSALLNWHGDVALDCWENEPNISRELLEKAIVATPHIAGYSAEGKQRGTAMMLAALNDFFGWDIPVPTIAAPATGATQVTLDGIASSYDIMADTARLKASPGDFEFQRNHYSHSPEYQ
jgi:erythronate-4-phosphate dehydrogenase